MNKTRMFGLLTTAATVALTTALAMRSLSAPVPTKPVLLQEDPVTEGFTNLAKVLTDEEKQVNAISSNGKLGFGLDDGHAVYGIILTPGGKCTMPGRTFRRADKWKLAFAVNNKAAGNKVKIDASKPDGSSFNLDPTMVSVDGKNRGGVGQEENVGNYRITITNTSKELCFVALAYLREKPPVRIPINSLLQALKNLDSKTGTDGLSPAMNTPSFHGLALAPSGTWNLSPVGFPADAQFLISSDSPMTKVTAAVNSAANVALMSTDSSTPAPAKFKQGEVKSGKLVLTNQSNKPAFTFWIAMRP